MLFLDEVHRFNKSQQDAFLPYVEDGTVCFIGATTENPSFEINSALLSRARVYVLRSLTRDDIQQVLRRALERESRPVPRPCRRDDGRPRDARACAADGDARRALNLLEVAADLARAGDGHDHRRRSRAKSRAGGYRRFDKKGEQFYDQISALHKSVRGTDPDAALYWLCRMLDGGCDPRYVARRVLRMASEDIGNADPRALQLALRGLRGLRAARQPGGRTRDRPGRRVHGLRRQEQCRLRRRSRRAMADAEKHGTLDVPLHLRNAPTRLMKGLGYGAGLSLRARRARGATRPARTISPTKWSRRVTTSRCRAGSRSGSREALQRFRALKRS